MPGTSDTRQPRLGPLDFFTSLFFFLFFVIKNSDKYYVY